MTAKQMVRELLDALPDQASVDDIMHALYIRTKVERGEDQIRRGEGVPHEEAKQRFGKWLR